MGELYCINCGNPAEETYELLIRSNNHQDVPLCDPCFEAIQDHLDSPV